MAARAEVTNVADPIPPAPLAQDTRRVQVWAERQGCRLQECPPNRLGVRERQGVVRDSVISTAPKKAP